MKYRSTLSHTRSLIGHGPVAPGQVIHSDVVLGPESGFELVEEPVVEIPPVKKSKVVVVSDVSEVSDAMSEGAPAHVDSPVEE